MVRSLLRNTDVHHTGVIVDFESRVRASIWIYQIVGQIALSQATPKRSPALPDVPTIAETGVPGYEATSGFGLLAPAKTPAPVIAKLNASILKTLADPEVKKKMAEQGAEPYGEKPEQFAAFIRSETDKWGKIVKQSGGDCGVIAK